MKEMEIIKLNINQANLVYEIFLEQFKNESWNQNQIIDSFNSLATNFYGLFDNNVLVCVACVLQSLDDINLLKIATKQQFKQMGYASKMMEYLIGLKNKDQTFSLEVKSKNVPAIKLYEKFGLKTLNVRKRYYQDGDDALCMFLY